MNEAYYRNWEPLLPASSVVHGRALVVAPHPDDEIVGCGGVFIAHRRAGHPVDVAVMTDGGLGNPDGEGGPEYAALRREETRRAVDLAGGACHHFLDYPDGGLRHTLKPAEDLAALMVRLRPASVFFPSPYEVHPDHRACCLHVIRAVRSLEFQPALYGYEVGGFMTPNLLIDVTPFMLVKERALTAYPSQLLHQDLVGKVRALNHARTVNVDDSTVRYAEAYLRMEPGRTDDFLAALEAVLRLTEEMGGGRGPGGSGSGKPAAGGGNAPPAEFRG